jgi:hypothetical protein
LDRVLPNIDPHGARPTEVPQPRQADVPDLVH